MTSGGATEYAGAAEPSLRLSITSFLVGFLKYAGPVFAPRQAAAFLERAGRSREVFLPFFYRWFDHRQWAQDQALRFVRASVLHEHADPPQVFHAPFAGQRARLLSRAYFRDIGDPRRVRAHQVALQRECAFLGRVRREFGIASPMVYVLHLGRRGPSTREAMDVTLAAIRPALETAREHGVVLGFENVADHSGDRTHIGAILPEIEEVIGRLAGGSGSDAPVGLTFDVSHAFLAYRGDTEAIARDLRRLLPSLVHLHVNVPRFYPSEEPWADRHEAPSEGFRPFWDLFRLAITGQRFQAFRGITYEVNWTAPIFNPVLGGSPLPAVIRGYDLVERVARDVLSTLDATRSVPHASQRVPSEAVFGVPREQVRPEVPARDPGD